MAEQQLTDTHLRAPFSGAVQQRTANMGEYVAAGAPVGGGTLLLLTGMVAATAALAVLAYVARRNP